ncbi:hypothetical protein [Adhaeribacter aquaticus]|uniref:hypothetical protein n=1 Tax=Adhaeribacter aquaticus TaxID=299567 RepID=UPI0004180CA6|nr:hypothetical protein [Adhaeribacter aquaticus]
MADIDELSTDELYQERKTKWDLELSHIEDKHPEYFNLNISPLALKLEQHIFFSYDTYRSSFGFRPDSNLPDTIREECLEAFHRVWAPA